MSKTQPDRWSGKPNRVLSFITLPPPGPGEDTSERRYSSPVCGLGWRFDFTRSFHFQVSGQNQDIQERKGRIDVAFRTNLCSGLPLKNVSITVVAEFEARGGENGPSLRKDFQQASITQDLHLGTYEPPQSRGSIAFEITLTFNPDDHFSFPTTPSGDLIQALATSLDGHIMIDTKFYLFSARRRGRPECPRVVYGNAALLCNMSTYFKDLLSESSFQDGVLCNLHEDVPDVMGRLNRQAYDYDSDSDLEESLFDLHDDHQGPQSILGEESEIEQQAPTSSQAFAASDSDPPGPADPSASQDACSQHQVRVSTPNNGGSKVRAYMINGTAYQTWKALVFYAYTNEVYFKPLKSKRWGVAGTSRTTAGALKTIPYIKPQMVCSPKSMYRLADYAGLPTLRDLAKEGIKNSLSKDTIITELFSSFTSRYDELIEMEADFLVQNFTPEVSRDFDNALALIVNGSKPYCHRTLAFAIKRLRSEDSVSAWKTLQPVPQSPGPPLDAHVARRAQLGGKKKKGKK